MGVNSPTLNRFRSNHRRFCVTRGVVGSLVSLVLLCLLPAVSGANAEMSPLEPAVEPALPDTPSPEDRYVALSVPPLLGAGPIHHRSSTAGPAKPPHAPHSLLTKARDLPLPVMASEPLEANAIDEGAHVVPLPASLVGGGLVLAIMILVRVVRR